jgi:hypothetical protein
MQPTPLKQISCASSVSQLPALTLSPRVLDYVLDSWNPEPSFANDQNWAVFFDVKVGVLGQLKQALVVLQVLVNMIEDMQSGQPIKAMQPKAPKNLYGAGMSNNNAFPSPGMSGGVGVSGPFGAGPGGNPGHMYGNPNAGYMTQQQQQPGFGMQQQYGMGGQPGMYQPQMGGMGYQQPQHMMQQQPGNAMAFL